MSYDPSVSKYLLKLIKEKVLTNPDSEIPADWIILKRIEDALFTSMKGKNPEKLDRQLKEDAIEHWVDLVGNNATGGLDYNYDTSVKNWKELAMKYDDEKSKVQSAADKKASKVATWEMSEEADEAFGMIFDLMHHPECKEPLPNLIKQAYELGVWPCGWQGKYPEGQLIVYWPYDQEPKRALC